MKFRISTDADREAVKAYLDRIPVGKTEYDLEICRHKRDMTDPQRNLYWKWIGVIASETGNDRDMLHKVLKSKFLGWEEVEVLGRTVKKELSIKKLDTTAMSEYMTQVEAFALTELGIVLPHPEDLYYNSISEEL